MPVLREQDFDKLAKEVVGQFLSGGANLADSAAKIASENGLNPDQIERLVQSANTMTFLEMMDRRKQAGVGDLLHEFDPIDSRQVIRIVIDNAGVHIDPTGGGMPSEAPMDDEMELPDEMHGKQVMNPAEGEPGHMDSPEVEDCEEECHEKLDPPGVKTKKRDDNDDEPLAPKDNEDKKPPAKKEARIMRARKLASILEDQYKQAEWAFEDRFTSLVDRFRRAYNPPSFAEFEKDAMAEFGDAVGLNILNNIRQARRLEPLDLTAAHEKVAALNDRHLTIESPELHLFEELHKIATKAAELERGLAWVRTQCA